MPKVRVGDLVTVRLQVTDADAVPNNMGADEYRVVRLIVPNVPGSQTILVKEMDILSVEEKPWEVGDRAYIELGGDKGISEVTIMAIHDNHAWIRRVILDQPSYSTALLSRLSRTEYA